RTVYGQPRGVRAIEFGISIESPGYNTYVLGPTDAGHIASIREFITAHAKTMPTPSDWCYVHNFKQPYRPHALQLPAGQGRQFSEAMGELLEVIRAEIPRAFESELYLNARSAIANNLEDTHRQLIEQAQQVAA